MRSKFEPRPLRTVTVVASVAPFALLLGLVLKLGVSTPWSDEWDLVPLLHRQATGHLGLANLWAQHNEHRQFFPQLVLLKIAAFTHWDIRYEIVVNVLIAGVTLSILLALLWRTVAAHGEGTFAVAAIVFSWMSFSPRGWENWLWGWEICWFLTALGAVGAAAILSEWPEHWPPLLGAFLAAIPAILASYSLVPGLAVWPSMLVIFLLRPSLRRGLPLWLAAAASTVALFLYHYRLPPGEVGYALRHPVGFVEYFLAFIGAPLAGKPLPSLAVGVALCAVLGVSAVYLARNHRPILRRNAAWVALALFGGLQALSTDVGRLHFGIAQSQSSRYTTLSLLLSLATLALAFTAGRSYALARGVARRQLRVTGAVVVLGAAVVIIVSYNLSLWRLWYQHDFLLAGHACLSTATGPSDLCLLKLYPLPSVEWTRVQYLRSHGLTGLNDASGP